MLFRFKDYTRAVVLIALQAHELFIIFGKKNHYFEILKHRHTYICHYQVSLFRRHFFNNILKHTRAN